jgi:hypothetical protein
MQPEDINVHAAKYLPNAYEGYTLAELGWWVHLLAKRATMRDGAEKRDKDLQDARNYLDMMRLKLDGQGGSV